MEDRVRAALERIRVFLLADGGDVELVNVIKGVVKVRLNGAWKDYPTSQMTAMNVIERLLKEEVPEIKSVEIV